MATVVGSRRWLRHLVLSSAALVALYPILWMVGSSVKPTAEIFRSLGIFPDEILWSNYTRGWSATPGAGFATFFKNSFLVAGGAVIGNVMACSLAAYAFARLDFPFRRTLFSAMLLTIMLPHHVVLIPQYIVFERLGWVNTFLPLITPKFLATDAFFIFLLVQFIRGLPRELDEAAQVDGCGPFRTFFHIIVPLSLPALVTTAIFTFIWTWDDFFSQTIYLNEVGNYTVPLGLRLFLDSSGQSSWGPVFAMAVLSLIPMFGFFLTFQRLLVEGITAGGVKG